MSDWERLQSLALTWNGLLASLAAFAAALFLRRLLPEDRRRRGRLTVLILGLAPLCHFLSHGLMVLGATTTSGVISLLVVALGGLGLAGLLGMLLFDIVLGRSSTPTIVRDVLQMAVFFAIVLFTLGHSGVNPLSVITTSAVLTAIIGLALQNIMANILSGLALQIDRTFILGDWIQVGARLGKIAQIRWRTTSVLTREGDTVLIPNAQLLSNEVLNYSRPSGIHRSSLKVAFHSRHPPNEVKKAVIDALVGIPGLLPNPPPECFPVEFSSATVGYLIRYSITEIAVEPEVEGEARTRLWYAAQRAGLEGPCPPRPAVHEAAEIAERVAALTRVDLFGPLDGAEKEKLATEARRLLFAAGERILVQGEPGDSLYLVRSGSVLVERAQGRATRELDRLGPGDFFGEMSLMTGEPRLASCSAITDVLCLVIDRAAFQTILAAKPEIAERISLLLAERQEALALESGASSEGDGDRSASSSRLLDKMRTYFRLD